MVYIPKKGRGKSRKQMRPPTVLDYIKMSIACLVLAAIVATFIFLKVDMSNSSDEYSDKNLTLTDDGHKSKEEFNKEFDYSTKKLDVNPDNSGGGSSNGVEDLDRNISGIMFGGYNAEVFMLSMTFESGAGSLTNGDAGKAYGLMQFDYRYSLVGFMKYAITAEPDMFGGFSAYTGIAQGSNQLIWNSGITKIFDEAMLADSNKCIKVQCDYIYKNYFLDTYTKLNESGLELDKRSIIVSGALMSLNVNTGSKTNTYLSHLNNSMTDEEIINKAYELRRIGVTKNSGKSNKRWLVTGENLMAIKLLNNDYTVRSEITEFNSFCPGWNWSKINGRYNLE